MVLMRVVITIPIHEYSNATITPSLSQVRRCMAFFYTFLKSRLEPPRKINGKKEKKHLPERTFVRRQGNKKKKDKTNVETKPAFLDLKVQDCGHCLGASTGTGLKRSWIERASSRARRWSSVN